ncbi:hypothetical protein D3C77_365790 [compost metagenome]
MFVGHLQSHLDYARLKEGRQIIIPFTFNVSLLIIRTLIVVSNEFSHAVFMLVRCK